jgi:hypothetical protein
MIAADAFFGAPIPFLAPTFEAERGLYQHTAAIGQTATFDRFKTAHTGFEDREKDVSQVTKTPLVLRIFAFLIVI